MFDFPRPGSTAAWKRHKLVKKMQKNVINPANFEIVMNNHSSQPIIKAMADAIAAANEIAKREHIKADRIERVQHFVVCLRRHLGQHIDNAAQLSSYRADMCDKALWYDIGYPTGNSETRPVGWTPYFVKISQVHEWAEQARNMAVISPSNKTLAADIEDDIKRLNGSITIADGLIVQAKTINAEGDQIIVKMTEVAESLAGV
jgi:hypothetical protein